MPADYDLTQIVPALQRDGWSSRKISRELAITEAETRTRTCEKSGCSNVLRSGEPGKYCRSCRPESTD
jgi:hypothetical protein